MNNKYFKKILGTKCFLSPVSMQDIEHYTEWLNDMNVTLNLGLGDTIFTLEKEKETLEKLLSGSDSSMFAIIDKDSNKLIGNVGLHGINHINGNCELGIMIGDKNFWNRGYGTEAVKLALDYAFNILNLHSVYLGVISYNERGMKCYEKAGFKETGRFKEWKKIAGQYYDMIYMQIMSEDFESPYIKTVLNNSINYKNQMELKFV